MDEFGDLEDFGDGKQVELHKTSKGGIEAAWEFVQTCSVAGVPRLLRAKEYVPPWRRGSGARRPAGVISPQRTCSQSIGGC